MSSSSELIPDEENGMMMINLDQNEPIQEKPKSKQGDERSVKRRISSNGDVIIVANRHSSTNFLREAGTSRILCDGDIRLAERLISEKSIHGPNDLIVMPNHEDTDPQLIDDGFVYSHTGLSNSEAHELLLKYGRNELPDTSVSLWYVFFSQLWQPMPVMIWLAAIVEAAIGNYIDMGILLFIQMANASIGFYETTKSGNAVAALKASLRPTCTVKRDGEWKVTDAATLVPGDLVLLAAGSAVPADCRINPTSTGSASLDVDQVRDV